ncbi:unnamed protein product, partial [marine sediment metagenome]
LFGPFLRQAKRCRHQADWRFTWINYGSFIPRLMCLKAEAEKKDSEGLKRAKKEWLQKRAELGRPVYCGPGVDFTKDTMNSTGNITNRPPDDVPRECELEMGGKHAEFSVGILSTEDHPKP